MNYYEIVHIFINVASILPLLQMFGRHGGHITKSDCTVSSKLQLSIRKLHLNINHVNHVTDIAIS